VSYDLLFYEIFVQFCLKLFVQIKHNVISRKLFSPI